MRGQTSNFRMCQESIILDYSLLQVPHADEQNPFRSQLKHYIKVTRPSFFGGVPSYFEALWYPYLYFYRKSNT